MAIFNRDFLDECGYLTEASDKSVQKKYYKDIAKEIQKYLYSGGSTGIGIRYKEDKDNDKLLHFLITNRTAWNSSAAASELLVGKAVAFAKDHTDDIKKLINDMETNYAKVIVKSVKTSAVKRHPSIDVEIE